MQVIASTAITISSLFYLYFLVNIFLINHYREPVRALTKGPAQFQLFLIIPVLNEAHIVAQTINQLSAEIANLPSTVQAEIVAVDDDSSDKSLAALAQSSSPYLQVLHRAGNADQGKGAVINTAVQYLENTLAKTADPQRTLIGILDADAFMTTTDLIQVVANFEQDDKIMMVQTGVSIYNQNNWLTRMQNFEFMCVNNSTQQLRDRLGQGIASGNGQFVRLTLAQKNQWGNSLLEDLEFTLRTWLLGGRVVFTHGMVVEQEAVESLRPFIKQRIRWCQGALQCMTYLPALWRSRDVNAFQKCDTTFWILMPITGCIVPITSVWAFVTMMARSLATWQSGWHHLALLTVLLMSILTCWLFANLYQRNYADIQKPVALWPTFIDSLSFQGYLLIISITPYAAIYRQLLGRTSWIKTRHQATTVPLYAHFLHRRGQHA